MPRSHASPDHAGRRLAHREIADWGRRRWSCHERKPTSRAITEQGESVPRLFAADLPFGPVLLSVARAGQRAGRKPTRRVPFLRRTLVILHLALLAGLVLTLLPRPA